MPYLYTISRIEDGAIAEEQKHISDSLISHKHINSVKEKFRSEHPGGDLIVNVQPISRKQLRKILKQQINKL